MITPDTVVDAKGNEVLFVRRWNILVAALLVEPSIKLVALRAATYGLADGLEVYPGNQRLARETGLSERSVREAWHFLRTEGMAIRAARSAWTGASRTADEYQLAIPAGWRAMPMLGPHSARFTCQQCGHKFNFNPQPCNVFTAGRDGLITDAGGARDVRWTLPGDLLPGPRHAAPRPERAPAAEAEGLLRAVDRRRRPVGRRELLGGVPQGTLRRLARLAELTSDTGTHFRRHPELRSGGYPK
jgi:hypothetical protein